MVDSTDTIFVAGGFYQYAGTPTFNITKIDVNGNIDPVFASNSTTQLSPIFIMREDETGDYIYTAQQQSQRLRKIRKSDGTLVWASTAFNNNIRDVAIDPTNGDITIVGDFTLFGANTRNRIAKLDKNGNLLPGVGTGAGFAGGNPLRILRTRTGNYLITGAFTSYNGLTANRIIELDGTTYNDTGFWGTGSNQSNQIPFQRQDNGEYIIVGNGATINGVAVGKVSKWTEAGVNIPFTTALGGIVPVGLYLDEVNNYIYISNPQSTAGIRRYEYATGNTDLTFETAFAPISPIVQYGAGQSQAIGVDSQARVYYIGGFTLVQGNSFQRIVRLYPNGNINTIN